MLELDGLRGIAIVLVVLYHFRGSPIKGGLFGVDLFLVLSGYLVTTGLLREELHKEQIALFYKRRLQKILPPLAIVVVLVGLASLWLSKSQVLGVRLDGLSALLLVANWRFVLTGTNYFASVGGPSPLQHLWSLSLEEQFYLVWPLIIVATSRKAFKFIVLVLLIASAVAMSFVANAEGASRAYFGTDTRFFTLCFGALLAVYMPQLKNISAIHKEVLRQLVPLLLATFIALSVVLKPMNLTMYRGGFVAIACTASILVASVVLNLHNPAYTFRLLRSKWLTWFGARSYSIYLVHWPIFVISNARWHSLNNFQLLPLQIVMTFVLSETTYQLVERRTSNSPFSKKITWPRIAVMQSLGLVGITSLVLISPSVPSFLNGGNHISGTGNLSGAKMRILVIGDSLVDSLAPNLKSVAIEQRLVLETVSISGCGLLPGVTIGEDGARYLPSSSCNQRVNEQFQRLRRSNAKFDVALWIDAWDTEDREVDNVQLRQSRNQKEIVSLMQNTLEALSEFADHVGVVTIPPRARTSATNPEGPSEYAVQRMAAAEVALRKAAERTDNAFIVDLSRFICPDRHPCSDVHQNGDRYRPTDGVHYDGPAAVIVAEWLINQASDFAGR
jgi:peptidoglycan/LPS O-acetylase OafA/YrhL